MSYILDALKKAESERNLGAVPSVHASMAKVTPQADERPAWRKTLPWFLVALMGCALLVAALTLHPWTTSPVEQTVPTAPGAPNQPAASSVALPERKLEDAHPPAPAAASVSQAAPVPPVAAIAKAEKPVEKPGTKPTAVASEKREPDTTQATAGKAASTQAQPAQQPQPSQQVQAAEEESVGSMQDLPPNIQRELPQVSVNGYIYAKNPLDRSVLINKRLLHEGETIAPDLVLEKMTPKGAILNFKGYRYRISY